MLNNIKTDIKKIFYLFKTTVSTKTLIFFILGSVIMGFVEMIGILSVIPFISAVIEPNNIFENVYLYKAYKFLNFNEFEFIIFLGVFSFVTLILSNMYIAFMNWQIYKITRQQEHHLSTNLLKKYLNNNYPYYLEINPSELEKNILHEVSRLVTDLFLPVIIAVTRLSIIFFITTALFISDPKLAISVISTLFVLYMITYFLIKKNLTEISNRVVILLRDKYKIIGEIFSGIREIKLDSYENFFTDKYKKISEEYASQFAISLAIGALPRYILEALAFGGIIVIVLVLYVTIDDTSHIISLIALYAIAGYRLLPAAQSIYYAVSKYKFGRPALLIIYNDLTDISYISKSNIRLSKNLLSDNSVLKLEDISFAYNSTNDKAVSNLNLDLKKSNLIGIIGPSGSGKSTLMDIVLGLLMPETGNIIYKNNKNQTFVNFKKSIGYVSQNVFISDDSIIKNIAFGIHDDLIDMDKVYTVAKLANIHEFIFSLPDKYNSILGKNGSRLSGGQKQRIAIARVLYKNPSIVIFDEATSQLDVPTEKLVFKSIKELSEKITVVIITHRVQILNDCDEIHVINNGKVVQTDKYEKLLKTNKLFQSFVNLDNN